MERYFSGGLDVSDGSDELSPWRRMPWISVEEAELIRSLPSVRDVNIGEAADGPVSFEAVSLKSVDVSGRGPSWMNVNGGDILSRAELHPVEYAAGALVAVVNEKLADMLFPGRDPLGKTIKVFGQPFKVIGVHAEASSIFGDENDLRVVIPHTVFTKVADYERGWMNVAVMPTERATLLDAEDQVTAALRGKRGLKPAQPNDFAIVTQDRVVETFNKITAGFFIAMITLSSVGLMVGGVGVVAIMMISVTERTREIGVRKALGATRGEIMENAEALELMEKVDTLVVDKTGTLTRRAAPPSPT